MHNKRFGDDGYRVPPSNMSSILQGVYTVSDLTNTIPANQNKAKYAYVTDLGGGSDMVLSDGTNWKHIRQGVVTNIAVANTIAVTPLSSPPIINVTGNNFVGSSLVNVSAINLYPGYTLHMIIPSGVLSTVTGLLGSMGVSVSGGPGIPLIGGTWQDIQWNGSSMVIISKGTL